MALPSLWLQDGCNSAARSCRNPLDRQQSTVSARPPPATTSHPAASALSAGAVASGPHTAARTAGQTAPPSDRRNRSTVQHARQQRDGVALLRFVHPRQRRLTHLDL